MLSPASATVKFGGENSAQAALTITASQWSRLGQLCNNEPLRQGRHRGKTGEALRDASEGELVEARGIPRAMIEAYIRRLQSPMYSVMIANQSFHWPARKAAQAGEFKR